MINIRKQKYASIKNMDPPVIRYRVDMIVMSMSIYSSTSRHQAGFMANHLYINCGH